LVAMWTVQVVGLLLFPFVVELALIHENASRSDSIDDYGTFNWCAPWRLC